MVLVVISLLFILSVPFYISEYLLGETILVAPVLTEGATSRHIYLPAGIWFEEGDRTRPVEGPTWLRNYSAPIDTLPYFIRDVTSVVDSQASLLSSAILVALCVIANIVNY